VVVSGLQSMWPAPGEPDSMREPYPRRAYPG